MTQDMKPENPTVDGQDRSDWNQARPEKIPHPTYWPMVLALGVTLFAWGLVTSVIIVAAGVVLSAIALSGWIGELRHEQE